MQIRWFRFVTQEVRHVSKLIFDTNFSALGKVEP